MAEGAPIERSSDDTLIGVRAAATATTPLYFIPNRGQTAPEVLFYAQKPGTTVWLPGRGMIFERMAPAAGGGFPLKNPFQKTWGGGYEDALVSKLAASGDKLIYSSYLGGPQGDRAQGPALDGSGIAYSTYLGGSYREAWGGIALDSTGGIYVVGTTNSPDFPVLKACQKALAGEYDAFVFKFKIGD